MKRFLLAILMLFTFAAASFAQVNTGRLVGTVADPSGIIPGATVVVKDNKTGKERTVVASDDGTFSVAQLEPGTYTVTITAQGHKTFNANDVKIDVGREYSLNATLEVGNISETVEVTAGADVLNSTNAELSNTVSPRQIQELPLNGRNPVGLILLQAGTASNSANSTSINGQRPAATNITRDGLNIQDNFIRANAADFTQQTPTTDDVAEFTVTTQNAGAESGYGASQVSLSTPRGQGAYHGAIFEYNRNSKFGANDFFSNMNGVAKTFRNFNQYGGKVGGPIWKAQNLFFFAEFEKTSDRLQNGFTRTVLTQSARQGIFTYRDNGGTLRQVNLFALPIPNVATTGAPPVPTGINPVIQNRILANLPLGNATNVGDQRNTTGYFFNQLQNDDRKSFTMRLDWDFNDQNSINAVYNIARQTLLRPDFGDTNGFHQFPQALQNSPVDFYVLAWRMTPSATFTNEVRAGYIRAFPSFPETNERPPFLLQFTNAVAPQLAGLITSPEPGYLFQGRDTKTYTVQDNAEYQWNNHSFRVGTVLNFFRVLRLNAGGAIPQYNLGVATSTPQITSTIFNNPAFFPGGIGTTDRNTANALFALLGGIISAGQETFNVADANSGFVPGIGFAQDYAYNNYNLYVADQWRVSPRLTVNLGLRYEVYPSTRETNGVISEVIIPNGVDPRTALLDPNGGLQTAGTNIGGGKLFKTDPNNFAPVISIAYSPQFKNKFLNTLFPGEGRTVIRGGFRISYFADEFLKGPSGEGDSNSGKRQNSALGSLNARPENVPLIPTPTVLIPRTFAQNAVLGNAGRGVYPPTVIAVDPNLKTASNNEYSFSIQREIGFQTAIEVRYVGAFSSNSTRVHDVNQIEIVNNGFLADFLRAQSNCRLQGATLLGTGDPLGRCTSAGFNPAIPGSQPLTVIGNLATLSGTPGGFGSATTAANATILANIQQGTPGALVQTLVANNLQGAVAFLANPNVGLAGLLDNSARYNYNALQVEFRRRFANGFYFQANYTFSKTLANSPGTDQRRQEFQLDANRPELEYSRVDYDQTHVFNFNSIYELPFGRGRRFLTDAGPWLNRLIGGFQINTIVRVASGAPFSIVDPRGVLNRTGLSTRNSANSPLTTAQIRDLIGVFRNPDGSVTLINPSAIDPNTGRLSNGPLAAPFPGQVFFNVPAGGVGNIERNAFDGPGYFNVDASIFKNIQITERVRFQIRAEAFNLLNRTNFAITNQQRSINAAGAFNLTTAFSPRVIQFAGRIEF